MSKVFYNGLQMQLVHINSYQRVPIFSEDGADYLYTRHTVDLDCIFNPAATAFRKDGFGSVTTGGTGFPAITDEAIRHFLMQPKKTLKIVIENGSGVGVDYTLLESPLPGRAPALITDANNGPQPQSCTVKEFSGSKTFVVNLVIVTWLVECPLESTFPSQVNPILSNRWSMSLDRDDQYFETRTVEGKAVLRSDILLARSMNADAFRKWLLLPPIPPRFKRTRINVRVHSSGCLLSYSFTDVQQHRLLGALSPVLKCEAFFDVSTTGAGVGTTVARVTVSVWGDACTLRADLFTEAHRIIAAKIKDQKGIDRIPVSVSFREDLMAPHIEVTSVFRILPGATRKGVLPFSNEEMNLFIENNGPIQETETRIREVLGNEGTAGTWAGQLFVSALAKTCDDYDPTGPSQLVGIDGGTSGLRIQEQFPATICLVGTVEELGTTGTKWSSLSTNPDKPSIWTDARIETRYKTKSGILQMPVSGLDTRRTSTLTTAPTTNPPTDAGEESSNGDFGGGGDFGPGSGGSPACEFVQVAQPATRKVVRWTAERHGAWPLIPLAKTSDQNEVLLSEDVQPAAPHLLDADGTTRVYKVAGKYVYGLKLPRRSGDVLRTALLPTEIGTLSENDLTAEVWKGDIISEVSILRTAP